MLEETDLEKAERHVREGAAHVARQREMVQQLRCDGHDATQAEELLAILKTTLQQHRDDLERIRGREAT